MKYLVLAAFLLLLACNSSKKVYEAPAMGAESQFDKGLRPEKHPQYLFDKKGVLAMANAGRDTNGSQFFITVAPYLSLNGGYTVFGQVIEGQDVADRISEVPRDEAAGDRPLTPVKISRIAIRRVRAPGTPAARPAARSHGPCTLRRGGSPGTAPPPAPARRSRCAYRRPLKAASFRT